ncbi:MAG: hypothetical protein GY832_03035 [Chloroflexi bacterium]|nr:hypothetical protein [Chloroflexota bacterium]
MAAVETPARDRGTIQSGLERQDNGWVSWWVDGDGVRYTSRPMPHQMAYDELMKWRRAVVPAVSLHIPADVVAILTRIAKQSSQAKPMPPVRLTWEDMAHQALTEWMAQHDTDNGSETDE